MKNFKPTLLHGTPPPGMRAAYYNGELVGFVRSVADPTEQAALFEQKLKDLGLWEPKTREHAMLDQARAFAHIAAQIKQANLNGTSKSPVGICPFVVNSAFSAEMFLKCLYTIFGSSFEATHSLTLLFRQLPNKAKDRINKSLKLIEAKYEVPQGIKFKDHLKNLSEAFVDWRYYYEKNNLHIDIRQVTLVLEVLWDATHQALSEKNSGYK